MSRKLKILHVATLVFPDALGGAERFIHGLAGAQAAAGHEVTVLSGDFGGRAPEERVNGFRLVRYPLPATRGLRFSQEVRRQVTRALRARSLEGFDVLHAHQIASAAPAFDAPFPAARVLNFHASHHLEFEAERLDGAPAGAQNRLRLGDWLKSQGIQMLDRRLLARAQRIVVHTEFVRQQVAALAPSALPRVRVVPAGLDTARFAPGDPGPMRDRLGLEPSTPLVVSVRRLVRRMGLDVLLRAAAILSARGVPFMMVIGGDGPERAALEELRAELGLADRVRFLGRVPDDELPDLLRAADVIAVPSRSMEGFGMSTAEGMASGTPVVASDSGASPELLGPVDRGLLSPAEPAPLAATLEGLLLDPVRRAELGTKCAASARARFAWPAIVAAVDQVYEEVAGSHARP